MLRREEYPVNSYSELKKIHHLALMLKQAGYNADNSVIITVSSEYSAIVGQYIRHYLSFNGEVVSGFTIDVPYPDETWDDNYIYEMDVLFHLYDYLFQDKTVILIEAGVIRGGNYTFVTNYIKETFPNVKYVTAALFENIHSTFKSDYVCEYYDDTTEDLTFWWERYNKHWR